MKPTRRWLQLALIISTIALFPQLLSAQYSHETVLNSGDPRTRTDIVILGDGYTASEQTLYRADVQALVQYMFSQEPFKEYQRYFNVHRIDVVSAESGVDHPERPGDGSCGYFPDFYHTPMPGICKNTALDATYGNGINTEVRLLTSN